ncbi:MAG: VWA domain-containing protein [Deltaproteobacteria bacterium]|nr:VWA domain-containing protein [Deltaproteobacteria bacterium]
MRFQSPQTLWLLFPLLLSPFFWKWLESRARRAFQGFLSTEMTASLLKGFSPGRRRARFVFLFFAALFGVLALARPQMGTREETMRSQGLDVVFLLDVSNSMLTEDALPSRLMKAKHMIRGFLDRLSGDRVGIVAFAGSAYPAAPLTTDYDFVRQTLEILSERSIANQGTDLSKALKVGVELLERGGVNEDETPGEPAPAGGRVIVALSDGEDQVGKEAEYARELKKRGIVVYTIGIGSLKGGPIPVRDEGGSLRGYKRDRSGGMVLSRLESGSLEAIAAESGGKFYPASSNEGEVDEIIGNVSGMERTEGTERKVVVYDELFQYPLAMAIVLFLIQLFMSEASSVATAAVLFLALVSGAFPGPALGSIREYRDSKEGVRAYGENDYPEAVRRFGNAQADNPGLPTHHMNLGDALLKAGSPEGAAREFEQALKSRDANEAARGAFNLGKAFEATENHEQAIRSYQQGLDRLLGGEKGGEKADPEVVERLKRALQNAQQQKQRKKEGKDKKDGGQDQKDKKKDESKDEEKKKEEPKQYTNPKPKFKPEKLTENDAKRILKQLQEQESKTQVRVMRAKTGKVQDTKIEKDW